MFQWTVYKFKLYLNLVFQWTVYQFNLTLIWRNINLDILLQMTSKYKILIILLLKICLCFEGLLLKDARVFNLLQVSMTSLFTQTCLTITFHKLPWSIAFSICFSHVALIHCFLYRLNSSYSHPLVEFRVSHCHNEAHYHQRVHSHQRAHYHQRVHSHQRAHYHQRVSTTT